MPKLIDDRPRGAIGRTGLLALIDEFNAKRSYMGIRERYKPFEESGVLVMAHDRLPPEADSHTPSPIYSAPRLAHSSNETR